MKASVMNDVIEKCQPWTVDEVRMGNCHSWTVLAKRTSGLNCEWTKLITGGLFMCLIYNRPDDNLKIRAAPKPNHQLTGRSINRSVEWSVLRSESLMLFKDYFQMSHVVAHDLLLEAWNDASHKHDHNWRHPFFRSEAMGLVLIQD